MSLQQTRIGLSDVTNRTMSQSQQVKRPILPGASHKASQNSLEFASKSGMRRRRIESGDDEMKPQAKKISVSSRPSIDVQKKDDELYVTEYAAEINDFMQNTQGKYKCNSNYIKIQTDVNNKMRSILIDWLVEVHLKFKASARTLHLAVNLIDRFLSIEKISRQQLQLVGVTCLMIAAKYEEIYPPEIQDFVYITDSAYSREEIMDMEIFVLNALEFNLTIPTPWIFLERYLMVDGCDKDDLRWKVAMFTLDLTLTEYHMIKYDASVIAASALYLTNRLFELVGMHTVPAWGTAVRSASQYSEADIRECTKQILTLVCHVQTNSVQAVRKKYTRLDNGLVMNSEPIQHLLRSSRQ